MSNEIELTQEQRDAPLTDEDYSFFSDLYKSDTGIRPKGHWFANYGEFDDWLTNRDEWMEFEANPPTSWNETHVNNPFADLLAGVKS